MIEAAILIGVVCLLAVLIDHFRTIEVTGLMITLFVIWGDVVEILGQRYRVVGHGTDRDVVRVRRCWR